MPAIVRRAERWREVPLEKASTTASRTISFLLFLLLLLLLLLPQLQAAWENQVTRVCMYVTPEVLYSVLNILPGWEFNHFGIVFGRPGNRWSFPCNHPILSHPIFRGYSINRPKGCNSFSAIGSDIETRLLIDQFIDTTPSDWWMRPACFMMNIEYCPNSRGLSQHRD